MLTARIEARINTARSVAALGPRARRSTVYPPPALPSRRDALAAALFGLLVRLAVVLWARGLFPAVEDGHFYDVLAHRIAHGQGYTWLWPDGAVTFVAHYPVGYPALLAAAYALFGGTAGVAMTLNAVLGAGSVYAMHRLVASESALAGAPAAARWKPLGAALAVALHPALVPYTAAVMTEGVTASTLVIAASLAAAARSGRSSVRARTLARTAAGVAMGIATLVRPQCLALAPAFGWFAAPGAARARSRLMSAGAVTAVALACVAPWTLRNCERMHRCALVSVNGGWNLLIGATTERGGWNAVEVPPECATVWDEAQKDVCFERAARRAIARAPLAWAARAPAKLAATFDYFGAAPWYLHASDAQAFDERAKTALGAVETVACRLLLLAALVATGRMAGPRSRAAARLGKAVALAGAVGAVTLHGWIGYVALPVVAALHGRRALERGPAAVPMTACVVAATAAIHAVFFGAGRYGLVVVPFVSALPFVGSFVAPRARPEGS